METEKGSHSQVCCENEENCVSTAPKGNEIMYLTAAIILI